MRGDTECYAINDSRQALRKPKLLQEKPLGNVMEKVNFVYNEALNT